MKVLHFAPFRYITKFLKSRTNISYHSVDYSLEFPRIQSIADITKIPFKNDIFDLIVVMHVLEHIPDDRRAMGELLRVLKSSATAIIAVPIEMDRTETYEDFSIVTPEGRKKAFKQEDHVRIYGRDIVNRFEEAGFEVTIERASDLDQETIDRYGLWDEEVMFICKKG
jgi:predicted SAM-dependent methyltransferase